jgi:hypothetical protein
MSDNDSDNTIQEPPEEGETNWISSRTHLPVGENVGAVIPATPTEQTPAVAQTPATPILPPPPPIDRPGLISVDQGIEANLARLDPTWPIWRMTFELKKDFDKTNLNQGDITEMTTAIAEWRDRLPPQYREGDQQSLDDYRGSYAKTAGAVKYPAGSLVEYAGSLAKERYAQGLVSRIAMSYQKEEWRQIVTLCEELAIVTCRVTAVRRSYAREGQHILEEPFWLSCRDGAGYLKQDREKYYPVVNRILRTMEFDGHLVLVQRGTRGRATHYRMPAIEQIVFPLEIIRNDRKSIDEVTRDWTPEDRKTLLVVFAYENAMHRREQTGYKAFPEITRSILSGSLFKQFTTVREWLETKGVEITEGNRTVTAYITRVFFLYITDAKAPQPGQLKDDRYWRAYRQSPCIPEYTNIRRDGTMEPEEHERLKTLYRDTLGLGESADFFLSTGGVVT